MNTQMTPKSQSYSLKEYLSGDAMKTRLMEVLPKYLTPERMVRIALLAAAKQPKLLECSPESVALALLAASQLGIEPNGRDGHLVSYRENCQFIPDYRGLIQLAYRSGQVTGMNAKAVHEADAFMYEFGIEEKLQHTPTLIADPGPLIAAWAMAKLINGRPVFVVLTPNDVAKRKQSAQTDKIWSAYPDAMWAKSAVRELAKWIPQQPALDNFHAAVDYDQQAATGTLDVPSKPVSLAEELSAGHGMAEPEPKKQPPKKRGRPRKTKPAAEQAPSPAPEPVDDDLAAVLARESKQLRNRLRARLDSADLAAAENIRIQANELFSEGTLLPNDCEAVLASHAETVAAMERA